MIETSSHSMVRCQDHPNEQLTNYCCNFNCLRPLCPECVEVHTKTHSKQQIESWKNCLNKSFRAIKTTISKLRQIQQRLGSSGTGRPLEAIEEEAVKKLAGVRRQLHDLVDEMMNYHEKEVRAMIRSEFRVTAVDTNKLKMAIEELERLSMKLTNPNTVLSAIKKSILLDHTSLISHFQQEFRATPGPYREEFPVLVESSNLAAIRKELEQIVKYQSSQHRQVTEAAARATSLAIRSPDFFGDTGSKYLHFFVPFSTELKLLKIDNIEQGITSWKTARLHLKSELPSFFKSIIVPDGRIYLTGGSDKGAKLSSIYRYDEQKNSLELEANLQIARSSHSICYMAGYIYIIGGFKSGNEACVDCETFNLATKKTKLIGSLCFPSANSSATGFNDKYVFKFGGVRDKVQPSNHVEMYSVVDNVWVEIDPSLERISDHFWLLSFSACVQINQREIFVFGGYNDMEDESSSNLSYTLYVNETQQDIEFTLKNIDSFPLPEAEGFWDNNPIIHNGKVYALQNITDADEVASLTEERRLLVFNGKKWITP